MENVSHVLQDVVFTSHSSTSVAACTSRSGLEGSTAEPPRLLENSRAGKQSLLQQASGGIKHQPGAGSTEQRQPHISMAAALLPAGTTCSRAGWGLRGCPPPAASLCVTSQHTFPWVQHQAQAVPEHGSLLAPQALPITKKVPRHSLGSGQNDEFGNWELQIVPLKPVGMFNVYKIRAACLWKMGP